MKTIEWAAGLFEGEGCISIQDINKNTGKTYWRLGLVMTDRDVVEQFFEWAGCGAIYTYAPGSQASRKDHWKTQYLWKCGKARDVRMILSKLLPHLGTRRAHKALDCLDSIELNN
jgi:hypothetical protein